MNNAIYPDISPEEEEKHRGERFIALDGKVLAYGKDHLEAFNKAKKIVPDLNDKEFLMARIHPEYFIGCINFPTSKISQNF